jgi:integrase
MGVTTTGLVALKGKYDRTTPWRYIRSGEIFSGMPRRVWESCRAVSAREILLIGHAALRVALGQAKFWNLVDRNVAIGVKLPKKKPSKPNQLLTFQQIKVVIEHLPEPTKTIVTLIVFGSMRVSEALALRWTDMLEDCIVIDERLYDGNLDDPKTLHGNREIPFDLHGVIKGARNGVPKLDPGFTRLMWNRKNPNDRGQSSSDWNKHAGRFSTLLLRPRAGVSARRIDHSQEPRRAFPSEMLEPPTMAQLVRPASSEPDGGRAIQGR